jgi:hypothetical protein
MGSEHMHWSRTKLVGGCHSRTDRSLIEGHQQQVITVFIPIHRGLDCAEPNTLDWKTAN